jgi:hypothetical protein
VLCFPLIRTIGGVQSGYFDFDQDLRFLQGWNWQLLFVQGTIVIVLVSLDDCETSRHCVLIVEELFPDLNETRLLAVDVQI